MIPFPYRMTKEGFSTTNDISLINSLSDTIKTNDQTLYCATTSCEAAVDSSTPAESRAESTPSLDNNVWCGGPYGGPHAQNHSWCKSGFCEYTIIGSAHYYRCAAANDDCANTPAPTTGTAEVGSPCISSPTGCTASDQICASDLICGSNSGECEAAVDESIPAESSLLSNGGWCGAPYGAPHAPNHSLCESGFCKYTSIDTPFGSVDNYVCGPSPNR